jgi:type III secretory pathway lipoprotein EscJ
MKHLFTILLAGMLVGCRVESQLSLKSGATNESTDQMLSNMYSNCIDAAKVNRKIGYIEGVKAGIAISLRARNGEFRTDDEIQTALMEDRTNYFNAIKIP